MDIAYIAGATRELGAGQGYLPLPVRDGMASDGTPLMVSEWRPTKEEGAALVSGASVFLTVLGFGHPPVMIDVGNVHARDGRCPDTMELPF